VKQVLSWHIAWNAVEIAHTDVIAEKKKQYHQHFHSRPNQHCDSSTVHGSRDIHGGLFGETVALMMNRQQNREI
jgi:hypothetical protein